MDVASKEMYHCKGCKREFWLDGAEARKRGSLCPNGCTRNHQVFLGETEDEIQKRRKEFVEDKGYDFEVNPEMDEPNGTEGRGGRGSSLEPNNYFFD